MRAGSSLGACQEKDRRIQTGSGGKVHTEATVQLHSEAAQVSGEPGAAAAGGQEVGSAFPGRQHKAGLKNILPFRNLFIILN